MKATALCRGVLFGLLLSAFVGVSAYGEANTSKCSEKFVGTVLRVSHSEAPLSSLVENQAPNQKGLKKIDVKFKVAHSENGAFTPTRSVTFTPTFKDIEFKEGASYRVKVKGNELCQAQYIAVR